MKKIIEEFREYLQTDKARSHLDYLKIKEPKETKEVLEKLKKMERSSEEFVDLVLYGLLPNSKSKYAKRVSTTPAFMNIKKFFGRFNYSDSDWRNIANLIFETVLEFYENPDKLTSITKKFASNKYSRNLQCGSLTPIFYALNNKFPIVNSRVRQTYKELSVDILGKSDKLSRKLEDYPSNIEKIRKFTRVLSKEYSFKEINDVATFDLFCYWFDVFKRKKEKAPGTKKIKEINMGVGIEEIEISKFVETLKIESMKYEPYSLEPPDRTNIRTIIANCSSGRWVLPHFQRYFDWKKEDVKEFFESISNGYYVGAFLLWNTERSPVLDIMPIMGISLERERIEPESIILDGQQRITSLYYAIKAPGFRLKGSSRPVYFYIDIKSCLAPAKIKEVIVPLLSKLDKKESYKKLLFPLYELEKYDEWVDGLEDFMLENSSDQNKIRQIRRNIDKRLKHIWEGFEIPYITLPKSMELVQATEIFERLNTRGKILSVFDLLIARMYKYGIGLRELWDETVEKYSNIKRYYRLIDKIPIYILQVMALCFSSAGSCKRKDLLDIYENIYEETNLSFKEHWVELSNYLNRAIEMLENLRPDGFGAKNQKEIPFAPMIPVLAALLKEIDSMDRKADCYKKLKMWYWASVFSDAYSHAVETRMASDFKEMKAWFSDDSQIPSLIITARRMFPYVDLKEAQYKTSAIYRGILSLLAIEGAKDFETGLSLENARSNDKDHIYPKATFGTLGRHIHSVLNMTWMSEDTNRRIKRYKKPSEYLKEFINEKYGGNETEFLKVLETHFISKKAYECLLKDERGFDDFLEERQKTILSKIQGLLGIESLEVEPGLITPEDPFKNKVMFGEVIQSCEGYLHWADKYFSVQGLKLLSQFLDTDRVKELKILTSIDKVDENFRSLFRDFKSEMRNKGVLCELRIITDPKLKSQIHDRWIISKDQCFNIPSPDIVARGQYSEIKKTESKPPFEKWWESSKDIITEWNTIKEN